MIFLFHGILEWISSVYLIIIISDNDFTFTTQENGHKAVNYGVAGDCYSEKKGCPQGEFSIDLRETSFRLSTNVRWLSTGKHVTSALNQRVRITFSANKFFQNPINSSESFCQTLAKVLKKLLGIIFETLQFGFIAPKSTTHPGCKFHGEWLI